MGDPLPFIDTDQSGDLSPGDGLDLNSNDRIDEDEHLVVLQSKIHDWRAGLIEGSELNRLDPDLDWLFIDKNRNGRRDYGGDQFPENQQFAAFGEPLFAMLDRDGDGVFSSKDHLIPMLGSRVAVYRHGQRSYYRGRDLTQAPHGAELE